MRSQLFKSFLLGVLAFIIASCAAKYGPMTATGGYKDEQHEENLYTVTLGGTSIIHWMRSGFTLPFVVLS